MDKEQSHLLCMFSSEHSVVSVGFFLFMVLIGDFFFSSFPPPSFFFSFSRTWDFDELMNVLPSNNPSYYFFSSSNLSHWLTSHCYLQWAHKSCSVLAQE